MKTFCEGGGAEPVEVRKYHREMLGKCGMCQRVLKVTPDGRLRRHSVRGRNTASQDRTLEILWDSAAAPGMKDDAGDGSADAPVARLLKGTT